MALMSETTSPPNGVVNIIKQESGTIDQEDLEDGEIFDDDEDQPVVPPPLLKEEPAIALVTPLTPPKRKIASPVINDRIKRQTAKTRRGKRNRDDDRQFQTRKRRRSIEDKPMRDIKDPLQDDDDDESLLKDDSPCKDWERFDKSEAYILDEEDEELCGPTRRGGRGRDFSGGRSRRMRLNRGGRRGGGGSSRRDHNICKFFMQGKCQRGSDCPFSHQTHPHRKFELCKFYMNDCCAKKDKCLFMHSDFPCKFHNLGLKCYAGKRCKFSHLPVSPFLKQMLVKHNQSESDKHFLLHLETRSPGRGSPDLQDFRNDFHPMDHHQMDYDDMEKDHHQHRHDEFFEHDDRLLQNYHDQSGRNHNQGQNSRFDEDRMQSQGYFQRPRQEESSEEEGNRTPMPSPSQDNSSDREQRTPEVDMKPEQNIPITETTITEQKGTKENDIKEEASAEMLTSLPQKQRELFIRIQQQQRQSDLAQKGDGTSASKEEEYKEEDWYSSDDEGNPAPLTTILKSIKPNITQLPIITKGLPDIDVNAVTKLLQSIKQGTMQQGENKNDKTGPSQVAAPAPPEPAKPEEKRRFRDPRLRGNNEDRSVPPPPLVIATPTAPAVPPPMNNDIDLRLGRPIVGPPPSVSDVDLRQLPFKPAPVHLAANEIDASITSHPPIMNYVLRPFPAATKPDYIGVQFKSSDDPRLKKFSLVTPQVKPATPTQQAPMIGGPFAMTVQAQFTEANLSGQQQLQGPRPPVEIRDPRQRALANDPRRKAQQMLQQQNHMMPPHPPPTSVRFLQEPPIQPQMYHHQRGDSDLRNPSVYNVGDIDLRFHQPPAPHFAFK